MSFDPWSDELVSDQNIKNLGMGFTKSTKGGSLSSTIQRFFVSRHYIMPASLTWSICVLVFVLAIGLGCERKATGVATAPISMNWTNLMDVSRSTIMTGRWEYAEKAWMDLSVKKRELTDPELKSWIQLQPDIVQGTASDPLKEEIRIMAVQELGTTPKFGIAYRDWLKNGLATNLFTEPKVQQKARDVLQDLEQYRP